MGVKDLWQLLAPVCERKSLWELKDKTVAIDLSGWVCDSQSVGENYSQPNMHLRNLFFRTSCLLLLGARPVFVLEGNAPDLKLGVMSQRNAIRGFKQSTKNSGKRSRYKGIQGKCQEMLKCMGVHCIQSDGEAEALCALLNAEGVVDGCISQDSDCFLYGGRVVFRNFTISASSGAGGGPGFSIDVYKMDQVEELLGLSRTKLIGLSLLCGCDYNQGGVSGVGKETAVKFLATLKDSQVFPRFNGWRNDPVYDQLEKERSFGVCERCSHIGKKKLHEKTGCELCGTIKSCHDNYDPSVLIHRDPQEKKMIITELNIRKKALEDENFPSQDVIDEFSSAKKIPENIPLEWCQPNLIGFMKLSDKYFNWDESYSLDKFLPLLTRWLMLQKKSTRKCPIYPETILKTRVLKGVPSYEVKWADKEGLFETLATGESSDACLTIEPREMVEKAFPELVLEFHDREAAKKMAKQRGKSKAAKGVKAPRVVHKCLNCGSSLPSKTQSCLCSFVTTSQKEEKKRVSSSSSLEELLNGLALNSVPQEQDPKKTSSKSSKIMNNCEKLKTLLAKTSIDSQEQDFEPTSGVKKEQCDTVSPTIPAVAKDCKKFSFENFLDDEEWSVADFDEEEGDLSDIVQTITGKRTDLNSSSKSEATQDVTPDTLHEEEAVEEENYPLSTHGCLKRENSFDDEVPYTPLIERVRKIHKSEAQETQTDAVTSLKLRRLSLSFDAFCMGENASSSPVSSDVEDKVSYSDVFPNATLGLGITDFLENSN